jgi:hypothetical protein
MLQLFLKPIIFFLFLQEPTKFVIINRSELILNLRLHQPYTKNKTAKKLFSHQKVTKPKSLRRKLYLDCYY